MMKVVDATPVYQQGRREVHALHGVNLHVAALEFVSIMGPSSL